MLLLLALGCACAKDLGRSDAAADGGLVFGDGPGTRADGPRADAGDAARPGDRGSTDLDRAAATDRSSDLPRADTKPPSACAKWTAWGCSQLSIYGCNATCNDNGVKRTLYCAVNGNCTCTIGAVKQTCSSGLKSYLCGVQCQGAFTKGCCHP